MSRSCQGLHVSRCGSQRMTRSSPNKSGSTRRTRPAPSPRFLTGGSRSVSAADGTGADERGGRRQMLVRSNQSSVRDNNTVPVFSDRSSTLAISDTAVSTDPSVCTVEPGPAFQLETRVVVPERSVM
jgi:hypothetical protein